MNKYVENYKDKADPKPVEIPAELKRPETIEEKIKRIIRTELSAKATMEGEESYEESEDLDMDEDDDTPLTPYEMTVMKPEFPALKGSLETPEPETGAGADPAPAPQTYITLDGKKYQLKEVENDRLQDRGNGSDIDSRSEPRRTTGDPDKD